LRKTQCRKRCTNEDKDKDISVERGIGLCERKKWKRGIVCERKKWQAKNNLVENVAIERTSSRKGLVKWERESD
jgi:hypothetical protein